jgi:membrane protease YdiL (CAAX protease family)
MAYRVPGTRPRMAYPGTVRTGLRPGLAVACLTSAIAVSWLAEQQAGTAANPRDASLWTTLAAEWIWVTAALFGALLAEGASVRERLGWKRGRLGWGRLLAASLGLIALSIGLNALLAESGVRETGSLARIDRVVRESSAISPWLMLLALGVAPGIAEELLFRGLVQRWLALRMAAGWAIAIAAGIFGLSHWDPVHGPAAFLLGCYLGLVAVLAGNVWAPMLCHTSNNLLGLLGALVGVPAAKGFTPAALGVSVGLVVLLFLWRQRPMAPQDPEADAPAILP